MRTEKNALEKVSHFHCRRRLYPAHMLNKKKTKHGWEECNSETGMAFVTPCNYLGVKENVQAHIKRLLTRRVRKRNNLNACLHGAVTGRAILVQV